MLVGRGSSLWGCMTLEGNVEIELRHRLDPQANQSYRLGTGRCELGAPGPVASRHSGAAAGGAGTSC